MTAMQEREINIRASDVLSYIPTYTENNISPDGKFLNIQLNNQNFPLELRNVGLEEHPAYIAWMDTHPDHQGVPIGLAHATAVERADVIVKMVRDYHQDITTIITPNSSKSIPSIEETVAIASQKLGRTFDFIVLPGGKDEDAVGKESVIAPIAYRNVTSPNENKYLGVTAKDLNTLLQAHTRGKGIVQLDDVYTSGGTDSAVQKILNIIFHLPDTTRHPLIVVARESPCDEHYPHKAPDHVFPVIYLPEFVHPLPTILQRH